VYSVNVCLEQFIFRYSIIIKSWICKTNF